jgi:hypothetical protein
VIDKEFFFQGETVDDFVASLGAVRDKFDQLYSESALAQDQQQTLADLENAQYVLVIAEPWSGDVLYNLPPLLRLAEAAGWEVRVFRRDRYPDLITPYRKDGIYRSIPVFVFYDGDFQEIGHWIERPASATQTIDDESLQLRRRLREEHKGAWRQETIREVISLLNPPNRDS